MMSTTSSSDPSSNDTPLLSIRFFDIRDSHFNVKSPVNDERNTYFKVRKQSKFGSVSRKFATMNKFAASDLSFYSQDKFLDPLETIDDLGLNDSDQIFVKRLIPIQVDFVKEHVNKRDPFKTLPYSVVVKVEEDATFLSLYRSIMNHFNLTDNEVSMNDLKIDRLVYNSCHYIDSRLVEKPIEPQQFNFKLFNLEVTANTTIVVTCTERQHTVFAQKIKKLNDELYNGEIIDSKAVEVLKAKISILEEDKLRLNERLQIIEQQKEKLSAQNISLSANSNSAQINQLQNEILNAKTILNEKLSLINSLQTERQKLMTEDNSAKLRLEEVIKGRTVLLDEITSLKNHISSLTQEKDSNKIQVQLTKMEANNQLLQLRKQLNDSNLNLEALKSKAANVESLFKSTVIHTYNDFGVFFTNLHSRIKYMVEQLTKFISVINDNKKLTAEINLKPIDYDYLKSLVEIIPVNKDFSPIKENIDEIYQEFRRPRPKLEYTFKDPVLLFIITTLYEKDPKCKGFAVHELVRLSDNLEATAIGQRLHGYISALAQRDSRAVYNVSKIWDNTKNTAVYIYDGIVSWNIIDEEAPEFQIKEIRDIPSIEQLSALNPLRGLKFDEKLRNVCDELFKVESIISVNCQATINNISKNLINVMDVLTSFKSQEGNFNYEKELMIRKFEEEFKKQTEKVEFVSTYQQRLNDLALQVENLKNEKINFEKDNSIYEKFKDFLNPHANRETNTLLLTNGNSSSNNTNKSVANIPLISHQSNNNSLMVTDNNKLAVNHSIINTTMNGMLTNNNIDNSQTNNSLVNKENVNNLNDQTKEESLEPNKGKESSPSDSYINIRIDLDGYDSQPTFFKIKPTTKLKKVLKSYKSKIASNSTLSLTKDQINLIKFKIGESLDVDYNLAVKDLGIPSMRLIIAVVSR